MRKAAAVFAVLLILGATVTACWLVNVWHESHEQEVKMGALRQRAALPAVTDMKGTSHEVAQINSPSPEETASEKTTAEPALHDLAALRGDNPDCIAWVSIPGTPIDFPVMQNKGDPEFYLKHDFDRNYSEYGLPFLDARCDLETSSNMMIYGHHMNDGSMFSALLKYEDKGYLAEYPEIILETEHGAESYAVAAVLCATGSYEPDEWSIFNCFDLTEQDIREITARQLYDTGVGLAPGEQILTLATCEYSQRNGRLAVIAVRE